MRYNRFTKATDESVKTKNNKNKKTKIAHRINSFYNVTRTLSQSCHRRQCHEWAKRKPKSYRYSKLKKIRTSPNATTRSLFSGFSFCFFVFFFFSLHNCENSWFLALNFVSLITHLLVSWLLAIGCLNFMSLSLVVYPSAVLGDSWLLLIVFL